jgi:hypothetical protein
MPSSYIAAANDAHFIEEVRGIRIMPPLTVGLPMPLARPGTDVADELCGRKLMRFITRGQVGAFVGGTSKETFVTPTPFDPREAVRWLLLPEPLKPRTHVLFLDPAQIPLIIGPLWVAPGRGIQYILPSGFPAAAIIVPGAPGGHWEVEVG